VNSEIRYQRNFNYKGINIMKYMKTTKILPPKKNTKKKKRKTCREFVGPKAAKITGAGK